MADAWRSYLEMAYGLTKTSRKKAEKAVREIVGKGNAKAGELQTMAEDLMASADANRAAVTKLVQTELDKALGRVGLVKAEEVTELRQRVDELEAKLAAAESASGSASASVKASAPAKKTVAKKTVAKKTAAAATPVETVLAEEEKLGPAKAEPAAAKKTASAPAPAKKTAAKQTAAKKTVAKKTVAKKAPAKKAAQ
ncbi:phasin family protein [Hamadaea sp. NPDC050747]|uniref:phasin family protein n=1 Tax=Hamadaea sp. NPDC050747 TaxID=3155789 RepID=UPI0033E586C5